MSQQINLFNPIFLKQKKYFSAVTMMQALGLLILGSIIVVVYAYLQASGLSQDLARSAVQLTEAQAQLARITAEYAPRQKSKTLEGEIQKAESEVKSLQTVFGILKKGEFGNTKGYSEYLRAFARQSFDGIWLTGLSIIGAGNELVIQGRTLKSEMVPVYITRLKGEPIMQGKSFASLEMQVQNQQQPDPAKKDALPGKQKAGPAYISFNLQSSGVQADSPGSAAK